MPQSITTHLAQLFRDDLDAKSNDAIQQMAKEWLKVEKSLQNDILTLATELATPPGGVKLDPVAEMVMKMQAAGYDPAKISQLLATQGIFNVPDAPQPKQIKAWQLARLQRYVRLLAQTQKEIEKYTGQVGTPTIETLQNDAAFQGIQSALATIDASISELGGDAVEATFDRLNIEAVENIVAISGADQPLSKLLQAAYPLAASGITDELIKGTAIGQNPRVTARNIVKDGLSQGLNHVLLVARDQQIRSAREATRQQYGKSGIIKQYRRLAAKQTRTCLACLALDGSVYDTDVLMELHPQDRCTMLPIVPGFAPIQTESGEAWFKRQPESVQKQMLGPGRFDLWQKGGFDFKQLATITPTNRTWGPNANPTTLKDLLKGRGGPPRQNGAPAPPFPSLPKDPGDQPGPSPLLQIDHSHLETLDLHKVTGANWGVQAKYTHQSYGGIIFDDQGRVLLRKPTGEFDGVAWTFPKGKMDSASEHPVHTALREVEQESGHDGGIIGLVPGSFHGATGKTNYFLMKSNGFDKSKMDLETEDLIWATPSEAEKLIGQGKNKIAAKRDLDILGAAASSYEGLLTGKESNDYLFKKQKSKPVVVTAFPDALVNDLNNQAVHNYDTNKALTNIKNNHKGVAILDDQGKLKAVASYDDKDDKYFSVTGIWAENQTSAKTVLINAGKLAAKQGKGISTGAGNIYDIQQATKKLGFEPGGDGKDFPQGDNFLHADWMKDWKKAPTKFKAPALPTAPPKPPDLERDTWAAGSNTDLTKTLAQQDITEPLAQKGAIVALDKIKGGQKGFTYIDPRSGSMKGAISYEDQGGIIKVGSAGFTDFDTNLAALKDVVKIAKQTGKDFVSFAPSGDILDQYQKWGFDENATYANGKQLVLKKQDFDAWLKDPVAYGKTKPPPTPSTPTPGATPTAPQQSSTGFKATPTPRQPEPLPTSAPLPEPADFPDDPTALKVVSRLGGSTGAQLVEDASGKRYVLKRGNSPAHVLEEVYADAAYQAAGADVPRFRLYDTPGGPVKLAEFIEGDSIASVLQKGGTAADRARKEAQKHFATDALFSNRDSVGENYDNMIVDKSGKVWRIDNGGSFRFRAQGEPKRDFDDYPTDLWTMRDAKLNRQTNDVFGSLDFYSISDQVLDLQKRRSAILAAVPAEIQDVVARRLENVVDMATTAKAMQPDNFNVEYADNFSKDRMDLRRAGLREQMPLAMDIEDYGKATAKQLYTGQGVNTSQVYDEAGRKMDRLRGSSSLVTQLKDFIDKSGGDYSLIEKYAEGQQYNSWNKEPQALKYHIVENVLQKKEDIFWWATGKDNAKKHYQAIATDPVAYARTFQALHAFTQEILGKMDLPNLKGDQVTLFRSEDKKIIQGVYGVKPGDKQATMPRGPLESCSIFDAVYINTTELTRQTVPLHRVFATYFMERHPGAGGNMFLGDHENEFVTILGGDIPFDYVGNSRGTVHIKP